MGNPRPTPTALRLLSGDTSKGKNPIPENEPKLKAEAPPMPQTLRDAEAKKEWGRITKLLAGVGVLTKIDGNALALYCDTWSTYREAVKDVTRNGYSIPSSIRADGSTAMTARNPAIGIMETARKDLLRLLVEFGMTPSARTRVKALPDGPNDELGDFLDEKG